jgi:hypothetical protein
MMSASEEAFEEVWVSSNYTTVFCTEEEKEHYLHSLSSRRSIPYAMSVVFIKRKLNRHYTKREILGATPDQLRAMIE